MQTFNPLKTPSGKEKSLYAGDSRNADLTIQLKDEDGTAIDITGWTVKAILKKKISDPDAAALTGATALACTIPTGTDGKFVIPFSSATISEAHEGAVLICYRVVSSKNRPLCQFKLDVLNSGMD